jgi:hypothetical protein
MFLDRLNRIGRGRFAVLLILLPISIFYLVAGLYAASGRDPLDVLDDEQRFVSSDFVAFWSASHLALQGAPELAYDTDMLATIEQSIARPSSRFVPWHYPPTFMLAVLPLALFSYPVALFLWLLVPLVGLAWLVQRLFHTLAFSWSLPIFPCAVICIISAQNGFLTAFLIGAALLHLDRRPVIAGIFCGLLTWKPHLAALAFVALLAGREWRALGSAFATAVVLAGVSVLVFGIAPWRAFLSNLAWVTELLESGALPWARMPSVYVSARLLGFDTVIVRGLQIVAAVGAVATVCAIWYRRAPLCWRGAAIAAALPLVTPYVFDYDLVLLAFAMGWLLDACLRDGWRTGDTALLIGVWIGPALSWPFMQHGGPPFLPLVFALLLAAVWRRAFPSADLSPVRGAEAF